MMQVDFRFLKRLLDSYGIVLCIWLLLTMASSAKAQTPYRDDARNWQMTIPKGWLVGPQELVDATNLETAKRQPDSKAVFLVSFVPEGTKLPTSIYVLAQFNPLSLRNVPYDQIKKSLGVDFSENAESTIKQNFSDVVSNSKFDKPVFDETNHRWLSNSLITYPDGEKHRIMTLGVLMNNGILHLFCYAPENKFLEYRDAFELMVDSIQIDPSRTFIPYQQRDSAKDTSKAPSKSTSSSPLFLAFPLFLLAFVIVYLVTKRKKYSP